MLPDLLRKQMSVWIAQEYFTDELESKLKVHLEDSFPLCDLCRHERNCSMEAANPQRIVKLNEPERMLPTFLLIVSGKREIYSTNDNETQIRLRFNEPISES